jgi:K+-transporting ATPase ATPase A chain
MTFIQMRLLPLAISITPRVFAFRLSRSLVWTAGRKYSPPGLSSRFEKRVDSGKLNWKRYLFLMLTFYTMMFAFGLLVIALHYVYLNVPIRLEWL